MTYRSAVVLGAGALFLSLVAAQGQTTVPNANSTPAVVAATAVVLTAEEIKEKEMRKACKIALCSTFHVKKPGQGDVSCSVLKTWRKEQLDKMMSKGKMSWPWGNARCTTELKLKREVLIKAVSGPEVVADFEKHQINCELDREKDKYTVKLDVHPKVTFKDGKAVKASLNWGKIDAPMLAKSALWSATAADNTFGVLQSTVVEDINDFIDVKCLEVKDEWQR
ncbi:MAG: hypothetical protein ABL898_09775 [Hyphomicrobiaceae bacterium]